MCEYVNSYLRYFYCFYSSGSVKLYPFNLVNSAVWQINGIFIFYLFLQVLEG